MSCSESLRNEPLTGEITLTGPDSVRAGQRVTVRVRTRRIPVGEPVWLIGQTSWGTQSLAVTASGSNLTIPLPTSWSSWSGDQEIRVLYQGKVLARRNLHVFPQAPATPLALYLGSKSIVADGRHWSMITAIPTDSLDNPVRSGEPVWFRLLRPSGQREAEWGQTRHLVAYRTITAQTQTGKTIVGVQAGRVRGKEKELLEVPDFPVAFTIGTVTYTPLADGRQTFRVRTSVLTDRNGNVVAEGTLVLFQCTDPDGSVRLLKGYTLRGVAEITLENPARSGKLMLQASVFGSARSNVLSLPFPEVSSPIPVRINANQIRIGPLTENLGQLRPDGTSVLLILDKQPPHITELVGGYAEMDCRDISRGNHQLRVLVGGQARELIVRLP